MEQTTNELDPQATSQPSRDAANWAQPVAKLTVEGERPGALNLNVDGKGLTGPLQGFGAMWQKTYRPIYEFGFRFMGGGAQQEQIWRHVLTQLARHWDVEPAIEVRKLCVDSRLQWSNAKNVWHNAVIRTSVTAPARWTRKALGRNP